MWVRSWTNPRVTEESQRVPGWAADGLGRTLLMWCSFGGGEPNLFFFHFANKNDCWQNNCQPSSHTGRLCEHPPCCSSRNWRWDADGGCWRSRPWLHARAVAAVPAAELLVGGNPLHHLTAVSISRIFFLWAAQICGLKPVLSLEVSSGKYRFQPSVCLLLVKACVPFLFCFYFRNLMLIFMKSFGLHIST